MQMVNTVDCVNVYPIKKKKHKGATERPSNREFTAALGEDDTPGKRRHKCFD